MILKVEVKGFSDRLVGLVCAYALLAQKKARV